MTQFPSKKSARFRPYTREAKFKFISIKMAKLKSLTIKAEILMSILIKAIILMSLTKKQHDSGRKKKLQYLCS